MIIKNYQKKELLAKFSDVKDNKFSINDSEIKLDVYMKVMK